MNTKTIKSDKLIPVEKPGTKIIKGGVKTSLSAKRRWENELSDKWIQLFGAIAQGLEFANTEAFASLCFDCQSKLIATKAREIMDFFFDEESVQALVDELDIEHELD